MENQKIKRQYPASFKVQVVMEMMRGEQTISQICSKFQIHPTQANRWREQALRFLEASFNGQSLTVQLNQKDQFIEELYKQIGKLKYEVDWLKKKMGIA